MEVRSPTPLPWWPLPVFIAVAFMFFWPVLGLTAFSDDHSALWNSGVRGIPWRNGFFRPLSDLTFRVVYLLGGTSPWEQRGYNVALHGANAFLLFAFFIHYNSRSSSSMQPGAWLAALLFIVYPFHQESIVWLVGRESSLGTFFVLLGLLFLNGTGPQWRRIGLACASLFAGALCYESALLLPLLIIPLAWSGNIDEPLSKRMLGLGFGTVVVLYAVLWSMQGNQPHGSYISGFLEKSPMAFVMNIPKVCARLFLPPMDPGQMAPAAGGSFIVLFLVMTTIIRRYKRNDEAGRCNMVVLALLLIVACVLPVLGGVSTRTSESDRFLYMPSAFLCIIMATLITHIPRKPLRFATAAFLFIGSFWMLRQNHGNWEAASATTVKIMSQLPAPPANGRIFVIGLPDAYNGAFIFRNGFREAVLLSGRDGNKYIPCTKAEKPESIHFRDEHIIPGPNDRWLVWRDGAFHDP